MKKVQAMSVLRSSKGFTLLELMMVVGIIGLLATIAIPRYEGYVEKARIARCVAEIRYFEKEIQLYYVEYQKYPESLLVLGRSFNNLIDPWGNQYQYLLIAGSTFVSNDGGGGAYYAKRNKTPDFVTIAPESEQGFWSSSWLMSEAWAAPPSPPPPPPTPPTPPPSGGGGGGGGGGPSPKPRKDRFLHPINSDYDLYSMGADGESVEPLTAKKSWDDVIRASDGAFVGLAQNF